MGGITTTHLKYEADFTRAVMTLDFDWTGVNGGLPPDVLNDWGLSQNPCWPLDIATSDPGYVLLTEDKWYATAIIPAADKANTPRYRLGPADGEYQAAKTPTRSHDYNLSSKQIAVIQVWFKAPVENSTWFIELK
ncbi:hypothetical protein LY78DRAFT_686779 [Colletotrichum sublineola]|nr:hypothetical protein LY78DRAFT_686779 [Colletotrichum sublineola]